MKKAADVFLEKLWLFVKIAALILFGILLILIEIVYVLVDYVIRKMDI